MRKAQLCVLLVMRVCHVRARVCHHLTFFRLLGNFIVNQLLPESQDGKPKLCWIVPHWFTQKHHEQIETSLHFRSAGQMTRKLNLDWKRPQLRDYVVQPTGRLRGCSRRSSSWWFCLHLIKTFIVSDNGRSSKCSGALFLQASLQMDSPLFWQWCSNWFDCLRTRVKVPEPVAQYLYQRSKPNTSWYITD